MWGLHGTSRAGQSVLLHNKLPLIKLALNSSWILHARGICGASTGSMCGSLARAACIQHYHCIYHCLHAIPRAAPTSAQQWPAWVTYTKSSQNSTQQSMTPLLLAHKHQQAKPIVTLANWLQSGLLLGAFNRYERHPSTYRSQVACQEASSGVALSLT